MVELNEVAKLKIGRNTILFLVFDSTIKNEHLENVVSYLKSSRKGSKIFIYTGLPKYSLSLYPEFNEIQIVRNIDSRKRAFRQVVTNPTNEVVSIFVGLCIESQIYSYRGLFQILTFDEFLYCMSFCPHNKLEIVKSMGSCTKYSEILSYYE